MDANALRVAHSSERHDWPTPREFFGEVERLFVDRFGGPFELDVAADANNHKAPRWFDEAANGLAQEWRGRVWCNPPYGRQVGEWVKKAFRDSERFGAIVAVLVPARTGARWFQDWAWKAAEVRFVRARIKFEGAEHSAPFDSALLIYNRDLTPTRSGPWAPYSHNLELFEMLKRE